MVVTSNFVFVLCLITSLVSLMEASAFCVVNSTEDVNASLCSNSRQCYYGNTISIQQLSKHIISSNISNIEVYFCSANYDLVSLVVNFTDVSSILIQGLDATSIHCSHHSGLYFKRVRNVEMRTISLNGCGFPNTHDKLHPNITTSLYLINSSNIEMTNIDISGSQGIGLAMIGISGYVSIVDSNFDKNRDPFFEAPGAGIFIDSFRSESATYKLENCNFTRNGATNGLGGKVITYYDRGGGVNIYFRAETANVNMTLTGCLFEDNTASYGGGMYVSFNNSARDVQVTVEDTLFRTNSAINRGGAVVAGYLLDTGGMIRNSVKFQSCKFIKNKCKKGGAVYLYAVPGNRENRVYSNNNNSFKFDSCIWERNEAMYGSAVLISPFTYKNHFSDGELPLAWFNSCSFVRNLNQIQPQLMRNANVTRYGRGAMYINLFHVRLSGDTKFVRNSRSSAIYLMSSILELAESSYVLFKLNFGYQGGAMNLRGSASIYLNDNTLIEFDGNYAWDNGGAIYYATLVDPSQLTRSNCFIEYVGKHQSVADRNATLLFRNNSIHVRTEQESSGQSIYLTSANSCTKLYNMYNKVDIMKALNLTVTFIFQDGIHNDTLVTSPSSFTVTEDLPKSLVPGKEVVLTLNAADDMQHRVLSPVYYIRMHPYTKNSKNLRIDSAYTLSTNNKIKVRGKPGNEGTLLLKLPNQDDTALSLKITLEECPPGFVFDHEDLVCECSTSNKSNFYTAINVCNLEAYEATLIRGYWAGYVNDNHIEDSFRTSSCPIGYCNNEHNRSEILLPDRASDLSVEICAPSRMGVMCGECVGNTTVYYHTPGNFKCGSEKYCHLGILLFILSQVLPVTLLFLAIIFFNIQLTTGALTGFLLYAQVFSSLHISGNNIIHMSSVAHKLLKVLEFIVQGFNLNFFALPHLGFCLFRNASYLDLLAFEYVLVVYALLLIILTVVCLNWRHKCSRRLSRKIKPKASIIHALSGFLVLCYAKTTRLTIWILTPGTLHGKGAKDLEVMVFYRGSLQFFGQEHIKYAIPALFALVFMTCLPPLLLLMYPLCYRVLALLRLEESTFSKFLCKIVPLERIKPLFDSIQSDFRDKHRYFAGLYFLYRLLILLLFAATADLVHFYFTLQFTLILILAIHGWVQPYKKKWHNRLDLYIFLLMNIINGITLYLFMGTIDQFLGESAIAACSTIQVLLASSPMVFMVIYVLKRLRIKKLLTCIKRMFKKKEEDNLSLSLSTLDEGRDDPEEVNYQKF